MSARRPPRASGLVAMLSTVVAAASARADDGVTARLAADVLGGVEGGAGDLAADGVRRTRTTLRLGGELGLGAQPNNLLTLSALVELEPRWSLGAELRYVRLLPAQLEIQLGAGGALAPETLLGLSLGLGYRLQASRAVSVLAGPMGQVLFVGSDLPGGTSAVWQAALQLGVRVQLVPDPP